MKSVLYPILQTIKTTQNQLGQVVEQEGPLNKCKNSIKVDETGNKTGIFLNLEEVKYTIFFLLLTSAANMIKNVLKDTLLGKGREGYLAI